MASLEQILSPIKKLQGIQDVFLYHENELVYTFSDIEVGDHLKATIESVVNCCDVIHSSYGAECVNFAYKNQSIIVQKFANGYLIVIVDSFFNSKLFGIACKPILSKIERHAFSDQAQTTSSVLSTTREHVSSINHKTVGGCLVGALIGKGGAGKVYKGIHINMGMKVAIKVLNTHEDSEAIQRFVQEGRILAKIEHPNIAKIINLGHESGFHFLIMRYIEGENLENILARESIPFNIALSVAIEICSGLEEVHKLKVVHRDIKPSNIIIEKSTGIPILVDFGSIHQINPDQEETKKGSIIGTPLYMSPEQCMGEPLNQTSDIYSLGATLYHLTTGVPPFETPTSMATLMAHIHKDVVPPHEKNIELPVMFSEVICKMMNKQPEKRYQSIEEVCMALRHLKERKTTNLQKVVTRMMKKRKANSTTQGIKIKKYFEEE
ncbi:serine/threonine protein kinase [Candidatus Uabimicrobium amorphum]|uniref:Protein kinase n=1 Tax=Uabimicrobium amorphum TaxID=2596890 RepID=A0A5S9F2J4_UABAM|nr:serine/threonine-protein kinase [Candidatus Uabimicrobium amorphum]BBM83311.1 protein kinase [Candidatus Uabimicrobium amorphum]